MSNSNGSQKPASRHTAPGIFFGAGPVPLLSQAKGNTSAQGPVVKSAHSMSEQIPDSGRQLMCTEVLVTYSGEVYGLPDKGTATNKMGLFRRVKEGGT
jgi:hypothetical protein